LAGIAEGIGLTFLLPLVVVLSLPERDHSPLMQVVMEVITRVGLPLNFAILLGLILAVIVIKAGLLLFVMWRVGVILADVAAQIRLRLVEALFAAEWRYFTRQPVGRLANTVSGEADRAAGVFLGGVNLGADIIQAMVFLSFAAWISWQLTAGAIAVGMLTKN
jgi:ATP-binding cassette subfamily C protein